MRTKQAQNNSSESPADNEIEFETTTKKDKTTTTTAASKPTEKETTSTTNPTKVVTDKDGWIDKWY